MLCQRRIERHGGEEDVPYDLIFDNRHQGRGHMSRIAEHFYEPRLVVSAEGSLVDIMDGENVALVLIADCGAELL